MNGLVHKDSNSFKTYVENLQRDFKKIDYQPGKGRGEQFVSLASL